MPMYEINIKEVKSANFSIRANNEKEAKDLAYWRLATQTNPPVKSKFLYQISKRWR